MTRFRRPLGLAMIALAAVATTGCTFTTQQTTQMYYEPADGRDAVLGGDIHVSNALIAAEEADGPGNLVARVVNDGFEPATVRLTSEVNDLDVEVTVEPGEMVEIGPEGQQVVVDPVGEIPGGLVRVLVEVVGTDLAQDLLVPVVDDTFPRYADLVPTAVPGGAPSP